jgi:hypothetical protein
MPAVSQHIASCAQEPVGVVPPLPLLAPLLLLPLPPLPLLPLPLPLPLPPPPHSLLQFCCSHEVTLWTHVLQAADLMHVP